MKKGCFLTGITLFTIIIGVGLYLYRQYWPEISGMGREKIFEMALKEMDEQINSLDKSVFQDSLKLLLHDNISIFKKGDFKTSMNKFGDLIDQTKFFIHDGRIDSVEFTALKNMVKGNEGSAEIGN